MKPCVYLRSCPEDRCEPELCPNYDEGAVSSGRSDVLLAADPCQACGAQCCKYVSIPVTELQELDVDWLIARGALEPGERGHVDWRIESRCPHLTEDNRCVIYDTRPETCRNYEVDGASCQQSQTPCVPPTER